MFSLKYMHMYQYMYTHLIPWQPFCMQSKINSPLDPSCKHHQQRNYWPHWRRSHGLHSGLLDHTDWKDTESTCISSGLSLLPTSFSLENWEDRKSRMKVVPCLSTFPKEMGFFGVWWIFGIYIHIFFLNKCYRISYFDSSSNSIVPKVTLHYSWL